MLISEDQIQEVHMRINNKSYEYSRVKKKQLKFSWKLLE